MPDVKLDTQLCFALYSASNHLVGVYRALLEPLDLTYSQFIVLIALGEQNHMSISMLAERIGVTKATMTPLLKKLEDKGFITREIEEGNERQKKVSLTKTGRKTLSKSAEITDQAFCSTGLSKKQAKELIALCQTIAKD